MTLYTQGAQRPKHLSKSYPGGVCPKEQSLPWRGYGSFLEPHNAF